MNKVHILGTMTKDVELKYTQSGSAIGNFGIAYNDKWKDQQGQMREKAHFFDVTVFGKQAETVNQCFRKGSRILIEGSMDFQSWEKDGQKRSKVGIKMDGFSFIDRKSDEPQQQPQGYQQQQQQPQAYAQQNNGNQVPIHTETIPIDIDEDEIPF